MELLPYLAILALVIAGFAVIMRGFWPRSDRSRAPNFSGALRAERRRSLGDGALEAGALASLYLLFPHELIQFSALTLLVGFSLAMVLLPGFTRPVLGIALTGVAVVTAGPTRAAGLLLLLGAFFVLRFVRERILPS